MSSLQRLAVEELLGRLAETQRAHSAELRAAIVEIHNEKIGDLLGAGEGKADSDGARAPERQLEIRLGRDGQPALEGASWHVVASADAADALMAAASRRRATADNGLNERSSRSHLVCFYQLHGEGVAGQLALVDLAGSERLARTEASGALAAETAAINKSLSALGDVMTAIGNREAHVPFRNSKLTYLLQPALSRGSRVMFIITASPDAVDTPETLVSLGFGTRARNAQLGPERKQHAPTTAGGGAAGGCGAPTPSKPTPTKPTPTKPTPTKTPGAVQRTPSGALPCSSPRLNGSAKRPVAADERSVKRSALTEVH